MQARNHATTPRLCLCGFAVTRLHGCTAKQLHSCTASHRSLFQARAAWSRIPARGMKLLQR
eukprot:8138200-Alexandrium_andersonii.AAC.1